MTKTIGRAIVWSFGVAAIAHGAAFAQGRGGGGVWTTTGFDAQRTASVRADPKISKDSLSKPGFQFLWKRQLETQPKAPNALAQPVFGTSGYITYKGFKGLVYLAGASDTVYSVDYDLNRMFWTTKLKTASTTGGTVACPGGLTAITLTTPLAPAVGGGGRGGRAGGPAPAGAAPPAAPAPTPAAPPAAPPGRAAGAAPPAGAPAPGTPPAGRGAGGGGGGGGRGGAPGVYVVSSGGMLHDLNLQDGSDWFAPAKLLPAPNATISGAILVNNVMYVATTDNCGGVPNGVYAMDITAAPSPTTDADGLPIAPNATPASTEVMRWESEGGGVVGVGPALGTDGTVYVATADGDYSATALSDAVVALENKTLKLKDYFTPGKTPFTTSPVIFQSNGKDVIAAANQDGRIYLLDPASLGGADHKTPMAKSGALESGTIRALATFDEADGTRWILAAVSATRPVTTPSGTVTNGAIIGLKVTTANGALTITPTWTSRDLVAPVTPAVVNGVVFALSSGESRTPGQRASNAVLYALDAATGKELWNSGTTVASPVHGIGPAVDDSQVYVVTTDGTLYTFGFVVER